MVLADLPDPKPARVVTTLDAELQRTIEGIVRSQHSLLERHGATNVAVVVLDNATSRVAGVGRLWQLRYARSRRRHQRSHRAAAAGLRAEAVHLRVGVRIGPHAGDRAARHSLAASPPPKKASSIRRATTTDGSAVRCSRGRALAGSINVPAVGWRRELGVPDVLRFLRRAGFTTFDRTGAHYGLGVTLGNAEVRLDELTAAYASFARGGLWMAPRMVLSPVYGLQSTADGGRPRPRLQTGGWPRIRPARVAAHGLLDRRHPLGR